MFFVITLLLQIWLGASLPTDVPWYYKPNGTHPMIATLDPVGKPLPDWFVELQTRKSQNYEEQYMPVNTYNKGLPDWYLELQKRKENANFVDISKPPPPPPSLIDDAERMGSQCPTDVIHDKYRGRGYFLSWRDRRSSNLKLSWDAAVRFCKARCLELVSLETKHENDFISKHIAAGQVAKVWTSGRKCDFPGCDNPGLHPIDIYGWFWDGSRTQLPPTTDLFDSNWSTTGGLGKPQPDNKEGVKGGENESCLAIRNNRYHDGIRWHDEVCSKRMAFVCEEKLKKTPWPFVAQDKHNFQFYYLQQN